MIFSVIISDLNLIPEGLRASLMAEAVKESTCHVGEMGRVLNSWVGKILLEEETATHCNILPGESHGQRSLMGYSP